MPREDGNFIALLLSLLLDPLKSAKCSFTPEEEDQLASRNQYVTHRSVGSTFDQTSEQEEKWQTNRFVILSADFLMEKGGGNSLSFLLAKDGGNSRRKTSPLNHFMNNIFTCKAKKRNNDLRLILIVYTSFSSVHFFFPCATQLCLLIDADSRLR